MNNQVTMLLDADQLNGRLSSRWDANEKEFKTALAHAALTALTPYKIIADEFGWKTAALTTKTGPCMIGVPLEAVSSGSYGELQVTGYIASVVTPSITTVVGESIELVDGVITAGGEDYANRSGEFAVACEASTGTTHNILLLGTEVSDAYNWLGDNERLSFGDADDVTMTWDGTNFIIAAAADDSIIEIGDSAATQLSFDVKWYGGSASGASYLYCDASADLIYTTGVDLQFKDNDLLVFGTGAGGTGDVNITWDTTNLIIAAVADDTLIEIGDSAATQLSFDLKWYGDTANGASYLYCDASANLIYTTGVDLQIKDDDFIVFGTGAGATGDVQIEWDTSGTDGLFITATADDTVITFGNGTQSFDLTWYAADANTALTLDASASQVDFGADDYGMTVFLHGATAGVHWKWDAANDRMEVDGGSALFRAVASGDGGITVSADGMTADPETAQEAGYITVLVNATGYQIPIYAA